MNDDLALFELRKQKLAPLIQRKRERRTEKEISAWFGVGKLRKKLRQGDREFLQSFVDEKMGQLLKTLEKIATHKTSLPVMLLVINIIECFKDLMNNRSGIDALLSSSSKEDVFRTFVSLLSSKNIVLKSNITFLLAVCAAYSKTGFQLVERAIIQSSTQNPEQKPKEGQRFMKIVEPMKDKTKDSPKLVDYQASLMLLINSLIRGHESKLEERVARRLELLYCGLLTPLKDLKARHKNNTEEPMGAQNLVRQIEIFEDEMNNDQKDIIMDKRSVPTNPENPRELLKRAELLFCNTNDWKCFVRILQDMIKISADKAVGEKALRHLHRATGKIIAAQAANKLDQTYLELQKSIEQSIDPGDKHVSSDDVKKFKALIKNQEKEISNLEKRLKDAEKKLSDPSKTSSPAPVMPVLTSQAIPENSPAPKLQTVHPESTSSIPAPPSVVVAPPPPTVGGPPIGAPAPPPPAIGGPPPPGGPMMGGTSGLPIRKKYNKPQGVSFKTFNWTKIPRPLLKDTIWMKATDENVKIDEPKVAQVFAQAPPVRRGSVANLEIKAIQVQILDSRRANNIGIILSQFKKTHEELRKAILTMDESQIEYDGWEALKKCIPTDDEVFQLNSYQGDVNVLGPAEKFLLHISKIPRLEKRMSGAMFISDCHVKIAEIRMNLKALNEACKTLKNSQKFQTILEYTLSLGNLLNVGKTAGSALGFKLESLLKLSDTKGTGGDTLLHFLVETLQKDEPGVINWSSEITGLKVATKESMTILQGNVEILQREMDNIAKEIKAASDESTNESGEHKADEHYVSVMKKFYDETIGRVEHIESHWKKLETNWKLVCTYFAEDPAVIKTDEFFVIIDQFATAWDAAVLEVKKRVEKKKQAEEAAAATAAAAEEKLKMSSSTAGTPKPRHGDPEKNVVDRMAESLHFNILRRRQSMYGEELKQEKKPKSKSGLSKH